MTVLSDSYMGIFLPSDLQERITTFMAGRMNFPFVQKDEVMAAFHLFGKDNGVNGKEEIKTCQDLAKKTAEQLTKDVRLYQNMPNKMDSEFTRQNYTKRSLQIVVESQNSPDVRPREMNKRIAGDPTILSDCYAQHLAYYKQEFCFELFGPFSKNDLPASLKNRLDRRMVLLTFNARSPQFKRPLLPFFNWLNRTA